METIANAWNIHIVSPDTILEACKNAQDCIFEDISDIPPIISRISKPFIKFEDRSHRYRPEYMEFSTFPYIDYSLPPPTSPFETWFKESASITRHAKRAKKICGLCCLKYVDLKTHLRSSAHMTAASNGKLFERLDKQIKKGITVEQFMQDIALKHQQNSQHLQ